VLWTKELFSNEENENIFSKMRERKGTNERERIRNEGRGK
jgi:hypothetical protein